jgi:hypothetical protein
MQVGSVEFRKVGWRYFEVAILGLEYFLFCCGEALC